LKWFSQDIVRANSARLRFVERLKRANEQHDGYVFELLMRFDVFTNLITIWRGHENVSQHHIGLHFEEAVDSLPAITDTHDLHTFIGKRKVDDFLNGSRIVGN
jgi:hypothetical protein